MNARTQTFELSFRFYIVKIFAGSQWEDSRFTGSHFQVDCIGSKISCKAPGFLLRTQIANCDLIADMNEAVEGRQVDEAVASIFHTVLFHRSLGKFHYKQEGSYSVGTIGYEDVDCDFIDFTYVCCSSEDLDKRLKTEISGFSEALRENDGSRSGQISLEFFQKKKNVFWKTECIPWEVWNVRLQLIKLTSEYERQLCREKLGDLLTDKILYIAEVMNKHEYVPKMPNQSELDLIFDTTYPDVQPYLFKLSFVTSGPTNSSVGTAVKKIIRDLSLNKQFSPSGSV